MPDMKGWSLRDAMKVATLAGVRLDYKGSGYVTKQSITRGTDLKKGDMLTLELETPIESLNDDKEEKKTDVRS
jgi:penicillin-binding protein 2B